MISSDVASVVAPYAGVLLDAYGVFWAGGSGPLPGAELAMRALVSKGKIVGILSNTTQLAQKEEAKLQAKGLVKGVHYHFFLTSGQILRSLFLKETLPFPTPRKKYFVLGEPHPYFCSHEPLFIGSSYQETKSLEEADFIYPSIPHVRGVDQVDPSVFQKILRCEITKGVALGIPFLCPNPDRFAQEGDHFVVRQGSLALLYEREKGNVFFVGKPSSLAYEAAMEAFALHGIKDKKEILMVGDTPETDILGANLFEMPSALLVKTGLFAERVEQQGWQEALKSLISPPRFLIERLGHVLSSSS